MSIVSSDGLKRVQLNGTSQSKRVQLNAIPQQPKRVLDLTFGQYQAFPLEDSSDDVARYLREVRNEAELGPVVYFVERLENTEDITESATDATDATDATNATDAKDATDATDATPKNTTNGTETFTVWSENLLQQFLRLKQELSQNEHTPSTEVINIDSVPKWKKYVMDNKPPPIDHFFEQFDRQMVFKLIVYFTRWMSVSTNANLSQWIWFALLRVDNVLDHNEASVLRDLGKKAVKLSSRTESLNTSQISRFTIDAVIVIVGEYYGQRDLLRERS